MRLAVLTMCTPEMVGLGALALPNKRAYCLRHGYRMVTAERSPDPGRDTVWGKIPLILSILGEYQWVFWTDADSALMNQSVRLEELLDAGSDLVISCEDHPLNPGGVNAGHFLVRNTPAARAFLETVYRQERFIPHPLREQEAMNHVLRAGLSPLTVRYAAKRQLNAEVCDYRQGDFVLHFQGQRARAYLMRLFLRGANWWEAGGETATGARISARPDKRLREIMQLLRTGRPEEAERRCEEVFAQDPGSADAAHALGLILLHSGCYDEGFDLLCRSVEMSPSTARFHNNLGSALGGAALHHDAAEAFRRALRFRPDFAAARDNLAAALSKVGGAGVVRTQGI